MVVRVGLLKCEALSQRHDSYSKVLLSQLTMSSFKVNQLFSPDWDKKTSSLANRKSPSSFSYASNCIEKVFNHLVGQFFLLVSSGLMEPESCAKNDFISGKCCTCSHGWFFKYL